MAKTFDEFLALADEAERLIRELERRLKPMERNERITPTMLAAIEDAATEIANLIVPAIVEQRPKDATEDEWASPVVSVLRARIESLRFACSQRTRNTDDWLNELRLACEEFQRSYAEFNDAVER